MQLTLNRMVRTKNSTIGRLDIDGTYQYWILEDVDRGLKNTMSLDELKAKKVYQKTAIPTGTYEIIISFSNKFQKALPLLLNVPAYEGIRIHPGNTKSNTAGCLLPGMTQSTDYVHNSKEAFYNMFELMKKVSHSEKIFITIQ